MITADMMKAIVDDIEKIRQEKEKREQELFIKDFENKYSKLVADLQNKIEDYAYHGLSSLSFEILPEYNYGKEFIKSKDDKHWKFILYLIHYGYYVVYYRSRDAYLISSAPIYIDGLACSFKPSGTIEP